MANVEDNERIRIALQLLSRQYSAHSLTPYESDDSVSVSFKTNDPGLAAQHGRAIARITAETSRAFGLEAHLRGPILIGDKKDHYFAAVSLRHEQASFPYFDSNDGTLQKKQKL